MRDPLARLGAWVTHTLRTSPFTNVYGVARSLLATGTFLTLALNPTDTLFTAGSGMAPPPQCDGFTAVSVYCMAGPVPGRWLSLAVLLTVMVGVFPRWTVIPHWYVAFSLNISASVVDGGDQIAAVLTLLLIPVGLCDGRKTHWGAPVPARESTGEGALLGGFFGWIALSVIRFQAAAVYFHAGVAKFGVAEWADGTAMYYWLADPVMGAPAWQRFLVDPVTHSGTGVALLTWAVPLGEIALAVALVLPARRWRLFLWGAVLFHVGIAVTLGLVSFALAMIALDIIFLRRADHSFSRPHWAEPRGWFLRGTAGPALLAQKAVPAQKKDPAPH
ncbi:sporulation-delaying protein SdpB family protein [Streptomyces sp. NL15-2K]|uniref:sporulation-delaying protein SdpB family protein n=1 Tax=Streptomyces sp. NL15-2K TaxID=376149 RepID=UPI00263BB9C2|nr:MULTISPECIES: sporulation-delaying protein SdpB family protein [Actinomycetes]WKX16127.1 hypothetical protein Q4V64_17855 [Kutzneria buriramensis]